MGNLRRIAATLESLDRHLLDLVRLKAEGEPAHVIPGTVGVTEPPGPWCLELGCIGEAGHDGPHNEVPKVAWLQAQLEGQACQVEAQVVDIVVEANMDPDAEGPAITPSVTLLVQDVAGQRKVQVGLGDRIKLTEARFLGPT